MAMLIPADSKQPLRKVEPKNGTDFQLDELYKLLTCDLIEILPIGNGLIMVLDEEGKLTGKPRNERATHQVNAMTLIPLVIERSEFYNLRSEAVNIGEPITVMVPEIDFIAGDVLICKQNEVQ